MRLGFAVSTVLAILLSPIAAHADTVIPGGNLNTQTWSASNSPYIIQGDITVLPGATLTIEPGVEVRADAYRDALFTGRDEDRVEITVRGSLVASGTAARPIAFKPTVTNAGGWYGIIAAAGAARIKLDHVSIERPTYGVIAETTGTELQMAHTSVTSESYGLWLRAGRPTISDSTITSSEYGVYVSDAASPTLVRATIRGNSTAGVHIAHSTPGNSVTMTNCTLDRNGLYGVYSGASSSANSATITVTSSIVTNTSHGIYRADSATWNVTYSNVWNSSSGNYTGGVSPGTGSISSNPLYVSATDLRLTSNSPSRFGGDLPSTDQGSLPYDGVATPGLYGVLWSNTTLTAPGGPYTVAGDLIVAPNVTLTLEPGVTLTFTASSDIMQSGQSTELGELTVQGSLVADGTRQAPITIGSTSPRAGSWYGIDFDTAAHASVLDNITVRHATYGLQYRSTATGNAFTRVTIEAASTYGAWLRQGNTTFDALTVISSDYGVFITDAASTTITNCVVRNTSNAGVYIANTIWLNTVDIANCTINQAGMYGIYSGPPFGNTAAIITVKNSIVTNSTYGCYNAWNTTWTMRYSNAWGNAIFNYFGVLHDTQGMLSADPQYVSATDLHLRATSSSIDAATNGPPTDADGHVRPLDGDGLDGARGDMGAYEFIRVPECGNGAVELAESCDDGAQNGTYGHCNVQCNGLGPHCGDGTTNGPEQCDDGNAVDTDACLHTCINATCGDGYVRAGSEQCDDGNTLDTDACLHTCENASCGDGFVQAGVEDCDDGNESNSDACLDTCVIASCGDGFTQTDVEDCDDGNSSNTDACLGLCRAAACGDGFHHMGVEGCDDGNSVDGDSCSNACVPSTCGNGMVDAPEQCDDGNNVESDLCRNNCVEARCGDGVIAGEIEECDDGNTDPGDGCDEVCANEDVEAPDGGCCDSSTHGGEAGSLVLASIVVIGLARRRRRTSGTSRFATRL